MSEFNITVAGGSTVRLPTAGKYCDRDMIITAEGGNADLENMLVGGMAKESLTEYSNERVTEIRDYTFSDFTGLQAVNLPNVETIGQNGFSGTRLKEVSLPKCETVGTHAFNQCRYLTKADFPALITAGDYMFNNDVLLTEVNMPVVTTVKRQAFYYCSNLVKLDFPLLNTIFLYAFTNCGKLETVIIRRSNVCELQNTNAFNGTPIAKGTGYVYVPKTLSDGSDGVEAYKASTNWSAYADQIRAIEDYPEICGG